MNHESSCSTKTGLASTILTEISVQNHKLGTLDSFYDVSNWFAV